MEVKCNTPLNCNVCKDYKTGIQNEIIGNLTSFSDDHIKGCYSRREKQEYILSQINSLKWKVIVWKLVASIFMALSAILLLIKH